MVPWIKLLGPSAEPASDAARDRWFVRMAERLLNGSRLVICGRPYRLVEVEIYLRSRRHPDPFAHAEAIQLTSGRWYFHSTNGHFRGGSYKGLDLTFGNARQYGGILFRSMESPEKSLINGCSLCVDVMLGAMGTKSVAELYKRIGPDAWDAKCPIYLEWIDPLESRPIFRTARVGLSLKRIPPAPRNLRYLLAPYRYLTEPKRIRKGKIHLALALIEKGMSLAEIHVMTGSSMHHLRRYQEEFLNGRDTGDPNIFAGHVLGPKLLSRLHGMPLRSR